MIDHYVVIETFIVTKSVDFDEKEDYFKDSFQVIDSMHMPIVGTKKYTMTVN